MKHLRAGFTIVELAIIIVVIGILATITVVAYNGVKVQAIESSMKSDLQNAAAQLEKDRSKNGGYPDSSTTANNGSGLIASENNTLKYRLRENGYCVSVTSTKMNGKSFFKENADGAIQEGVCLPGPANVVTLAGSLTPGYANGEGTAARFNILNEVDINYGYGIDIASDGNVYIADTGNNVIRKMTPSGTVSTIAGMPGDGGEIQSNNGLTSSFNYPFDLSVIASEGEEGLVVPTGSCLRYVGLTNSNHPTYFINEGALANHDGHKECAYSTQSTTVSEWAALYRDPSSVAVDSNNNVYINESDSDKVRKMFWNTSDDWWDSVSVLTAADEFESETRFGIDPQNRVYGTTEDHQIVRFTPDGTLSDVAGSSTPGFADGTGGAARFNNPLGMDVDGDGNVYVADCSNHRIRKITPEGVVSTIAGSATEGHIDAIGGAARFYCPVDVAINQDGTLMYVLETRESNILANQPAGLYVRKLTM